MSARKSVRVKNARTPRVDALEPRWVFSAPLIDGGVSQITYGGHSGKAVTGQYNVAVRPGVDFAPLAARAGFEVIRSLGGSLGGGTFFTIETSLTPARVANWASRAARLVEAVSPNWLVTTARSTNDPLLDQQYSLSNGGQVIPSPSTVAQPLEPRQVGKPGADMSITRAWDLTTGNSNNVVAVLDTGLDVGHSDLAANIWTNPGETAANGIDDDGNGFVDDINGYDFVGNDAILTDLNGHGTAVAGVIGAEGNNSRGISGVTWSVKLMGVKVLSDNSTSGPDQPVGSSAVIAGINYVSLMKSRGVPIVAANASLGGFSLVFDPALFAALRRLEAQDVVFVAAAGNETINADQFNANPGRASSLLSNTLVVAATDNQDKLATFSNFGARSVSVAAPGVAVLTTLSREVDGLPGSIVANITDPIDPLNPTRLPDKYVSIDGTSFSAPNVAGIVALAKAAKPNATAVEIVNAIKLGVDIIPSLEGLTTLAPRKVETGGRVNAYRTLRHLLNSTTSTVSTLAGNWRGTYGNYAAPANTPAPVAPSSFVYGASTGTTLQFLQGSPVPTTASVRTTPRVKAGDARLPQSPVDATRSTSALRSEEPISLGFDTGLTPIRITAYVLDAERARRSQIVRVVDQDSGEVLESVSVSRFENGQYITFEVSGRIALQVIPQRGDAVLNALFVDAAPTANQALVATDTLTRGNWINRYGDQGYALPGTFTTLPAGVSFFTGAQVGSSRAVRDGLQPASPFSATTPSTGFLTAGPGGFDVQLNIATSVTTAPGLALPSTRQVSFYTFNNSRTARAQRVSVIDPATGLVKASQDVSLPVRSGAYVTFNLSGNNTIRFTSLGGGDPTLAGAFFNSSAVAAFAGNGSREIPGDTLDNNANGQTDERGTGNTAVYVGADTTTGGQWRGRFGTVGQYVVGAQATFPSIVTVSPIITNALSGQRIVASSTAARQAPQNPNLLTGGIVGQIFTFASTELTLTLASDTPSSRVSAYFVDFERAGRVQQVEIVDANTNQVLSTQVLREFRNGKYLTWEITGSVKLRITRIAGPDAVLSAVFFD